MSTKQNKVALSCILMLVLFSGLFHSQGKAQKLKTMASNTFNGAMTGGILGGGTMALQNSDHWGPVRFGVGLGTLGGLAIGAHDVAQTSEGQTYLIDGTFNNGHATTVIILLDTIYGGATGALVGTAVQLMLDEPIVEGIQYGAGAGVWGGFLFGMMDAFYLSNTRTQMASSLPQPSLKGSSDWLALQKEQTQIRFLRPQLYSFKKITDQSIKQKAGLSLSMFEVSVRL